MTAGPDKRTIETHALRSGDLYRLLTGLVVPRPIAWVGTVSADGSPNLAPFSFCTAVAWRPPTVLFSTETISKRKDTLVNAETTREFTLNVVTEEITEAMVLTSGTYGPEVDEFNVAELTAAEGSIVAAPLVAEAKANMECRVTEIVEKIGRASCRERV